MNALFIDIAEAFARVHGAPIPKQLLTIGNPDTGWYVCLNTTERELESIAPITAHISWNGFPAGIIDPSGGVIAAGEAANQQTFRDWLEGVK